LAGPAAFQFTTSARQKGRTIATIVRKNKHWEEQIRVFSIREYASEHVQGIGSRLELAVSISRRHESRKWRIGMNFSKSSLCAAALAIIGIDGCNGSGPSQQQIQQQAEQTTIAAKKDAKDAAAATRVAAAEAEKDVNAAAAGIKNGLQQNTPGDADNRTNLNSSTQIRIAMLPGISMAKAGEIVDHRPYASAHQLVTRGLLTEDQYRKIAADVTTR